MVVVHISFESPTARSAGYHTLEPTDGKRSGYGFANLGALRTTSE